jgi:hypothetical protein
MLCAFNTHISRNRAREMQQPCGAVGWRCWLALLAGAAAGARCNSAKFFCIYIVQQRFAACQGLDNGPLREGEARPTDNSQRGNIMAYRTKATGTETAIVTRDQWHNVLATVNDAHTVDQWLASSHSGDDFAQSLARYYAKRGGLTARQLHAALGVATGARKAPERRYTDATDVTAANAGVHRITNTQRTVLRTAIVQAPAWDAYRKAHNINSAALSSTSDFVTVANACGVNIPEVLALHNAKATDATTDATTGGAVEEGKAAFDAVVTKAAPVALFDETRVRQIAREEAQAVFEPDAVEVIIVDKGHCKIEVTETLVHPQFKNLLQAMIARDFEGNRLGCMLVGPAATGKSYSGRQAAKALGIPFYFQGTALESYDLVGFVDANGTYHETQFVKAFRDGGAFLADEGDSWEAGALTAINGALANGYMPLPTGETIARHADFVCIMGTNTWGYGADAEYSSRQKLDGATLSRFPIKLAWNVCEELEQSITMAKCAMDKRAIDWTTEIQLMRNIMSDMGLPKIADARAIQAGAALLLAGVELQLVRDMTYLGPLDEDQRQAVSNKLAMINAKRGN